jgi:hypothetical protein
LLFISKGDTFLHIIMKKKGCKIHEGHAIIFALFFYLVPIYNYNIHVWEGRLFVCFYLSCWDLPNHNNFCHTFGTIGSFQWVRVDQVGFIMFWLHNGEVIEQLNNFFTKNSFKSKLNFIRKLGTFLVFCKVQEILNFE